MFKSKFLKYKTKYFNTEYDTENNYYIKIIYIQTHIILY